MSFPGNEKYTEELVTQDVVIDFDIIFCLVLLTNGSKASWSRYTGIDCLWLLNNYPGLEDMNNFDSAKSTNYHNTLYKIGHPVWDISLPRVWVNNI